MGFKSLLALIIVIGLAVGAAGGALLNRNASTPSAQISSTVQSARQANGPNTSANDPSQGGQAPGGAAAQNQAQQRAASVTGTVEKVDGNVLTLRMPNGASVSATVGDGAAIRRVVPGSLGDLAAGQNVTITGQRGADGAITATAVQVLPEGQGAADAGSPSAAAPEGAAAQAPRVQRQAQAGAP